MSTDALSSSVERRAEDRTLASSGCFRCYVVKTELFNCVESLACLSIEGSRDCGIGAPLSGADRRYLVSSCCKSPCKPCLLG